MRPAQPRRSSAARRSSPALPPFAQTIADRPRQQLAPERALAVEQAVGGERLPAALDLREQIALAGDADAL